MLSANTPDDYVSSAVTLLVLGSLTSLGYWLYNQATDWFYRQFLVTITVKKPDVSYYWIAEFLTEHRHELYSASNLTLAVNKEGRRQTRIHQGEEEEDEFEKQDLKLLPGEGLHVFKFKGKFVWINRHIGQPVQQGMFGKPIISESFTVSMLGRSTKGLEELFMEAYRLYKEEQGHMTKVYHLEDGWSWRMASARPPRPLDSVVLEGNLSRSIVDDVQNFFASEQWYRGCGIPFRRGFLLYGPPGCGKTSFIQAIAGELGLNICVLNLSNRSLDDEGLNSRLIDAPTKSIILLEDIDAVFVGRAAAASEDQFQRNQAPSITFSGLLNALDGVASQEGRVLFMTTNHKERLDPALIRPGRCDVLVKFDLASAAQAKAMFLRFYPEETDLAKDVQKLLAERAVSPAALQGHFLKHRDDPLKALKNLPDLLNSARDENRSGGAMQIGIWLKRLALPEHYGDKLRKMQVMYVADLFTLSTGDVVTLMDIKNELHKARVEGFLDGKEEVKQKFTLQKSNVINQIFAKYCSNATSEQTSQFTSLCPADELSAYEIEHFLARFVDKPKKAIDSVDELLEVANIHSTDDLLRRSTVRMHEMTVDDWLDQMGQSAAKEKFREEGIDDMEQVFEFSESDLDGLGITKIGDKWRCIKDLERRKQQLELCT